MVEKIILSSRTSWRSFCCGWLSTWPISAVGGCPSSPSYRMITTAAILLLEAYNLRRKRCSATIDTKHATKRSCGNSTFWPCARPKNDYTVSAFRRWSARPRGTLTLWSKFLHRRRLAPPVKVRPQRSTAHLLRVRVACQSALRYPRREYGCGTDKPSATGRAARRPNERRLPSL